MTIVRGGAEMIGRLYIIMGMARGRLNPPPRLFLMTCTSRNNPSAPITSTPATMTIGIHGIALLLIPTAFFELLSIRHNEKGAETTAALVVVFVLSCRCGA
jgi:hypothetical protein